MLSQDRSSLPTPPPAVPPFKWRGQVDCWVGPFSTEEVARFFPYLIEEPHDLSYETCLRDGSDGYYLSLIAG